MLVASRGNVVLAMIIGLTFLLAVGCEEDVAEPKQPEEPQAVTNPNKPNANALIVLENIFGDVGRDNSIWVTAEDNLAGYFFIGVYDSEYGIGRLGSDGSLQWFESTDFIPQDLYAVGAPATGVIAVGGRDVDSDGDEDHGVAALYDNDGVYLSHEVYSDAAGDTWLRSVAPLSDTTLVVVGGMESSTDKYPFVARLDVIGDSALVNRQAVAMSGLPDVWLQNVVTVPSIPPNNGDVTVFVSGHRLGEPLNITAHALTIPNDNLDQVDIGWTRDIRGYAGMYSGMYPGNTMSLLAGNLYLAGETDDNNKTPGPAGGGHWVSGLAASVSTSGQVNWIRVVGLSQTTDTFKGLFVVADALYAVGEYSHFYNIPSKRDFGLGWLSKIRLSTGEVTSNMSFGSVRYDAGFNNAIVRGQSAYCVGWTVDGADNSGYRCWFAELDISQSPSSEILIGIEKATPKLPVNEALGRRQQRK